jgi:hypothetical protein
MTAQLMVQPSSLISSGMKMSEFGNIYLFKFTEELQLRFEELLAKKLQNSNFQQQLSKAEEKGGKAASVAVSNLGSGGGGSSGTKLAEAGPTQHDKNKDTKTNVIVAAKENNKVNTIEKKAA